MNKIICDICGTTYPETSDCCPICGSTQDLSEEMLGEDLLDEGIKGRAGLFTAKKKEIFDYDEVNAQSEDEDFEDEEYEEEEVYDEEEEEETSHHNTVLVILLTILIAGLLMAAGFVFVRYILPYTTAHEETPIQTTAFVEAIPEETTEVSIPCETLIISSGNVAELNAEGQHFLLHVKPMPENTTDRIIYTSADERVATVTEDGRITAVSEGETKIYISCGMVSMECPVVIRYVEETVPPTTETVVDATVPAEESTIPVVEAVDPEETRTPAVSGEIKPGVALKLKKTDIMLGVYYQFTLELDCDLEQNEVQWSSEHPHIAKVDENGVVTAVKSGTTAITATYGDQTVTCMVRCS